MRLTKFIKRIFPYICTIFVVAVMVFTAEYADNKEIIFPEITALAVGYMVAKKRSWTVNGKRMLLLITICALLGVGIVRYSNLNIYAEVLLAFTISQILFMYSGTTFAPFVSAIVLPVMMQTTSIVYPIAAFTLTLIIVLFHKLLLWLRIREDQPYNPVMLNSFDDKIDTLLRIICVAILACIAFGTGYRFTIAPPLLVAFTEFSRPRNKTRNKPLKTIFVLTACAVIGASSRYLISLKLNLPLTVGAVAAVTIMLLIVHFTKMYMPPAGAITMLSMIIPEEAIITYPVQIFVGSSLVVIISRLLFMGRQDKRLYENEHELDAN